MALEQSIKDALKDVSKSIIAKIEKLSDTAEATEKVREANKDLSNQRTDLEKKEKDLKSQIAEFETGKTKFENSIKEKDLKISTLEKEKLTPEELAKYKASEDIQAKMNAMSETLDSVKKELSDSKEKAVESDKRAAEATKNAAIEAQKIKVQKELLKNNVIDSKKGSSNTIALHALAALGNYKIDFDDGKAVEKYFTKNDKNELVASNLAGIVKDFVENNQTSVSPSGNNGTGENHNSSRYSSTSSPQTFQEQQAVAEKLLNS